MLDDEGNYQLEGSITGFDGDGHVLRDMTSRSGQILVPAGLWRRAVITSGVNEGKFSNLKGNTFTFEVRRAATGKVDFAGPEGEMFREILFANLSNTSHTVVLRADGPVELHALDVFEPPLQ
jgi:hypothetical protein